LCHLNETLERMSIPDTADVVFPHPVYGSLGWLSVVNPGPNTATAIQDLLRTAHHLARARHQGRSESKSD